MILLPLSGDIFQSGDEQFHKIIIFVQDRANVLKPL